MTTGKIIALTVWTLLETEISVYARDADFCVYVEEMEGERESFNLSISDSYLFMLVQSI